MNPFRKDYNGWILCPSTRFLGKFYYFNPATGQAVWNLSDMERMMASRPTFTNPEKWHTYPEPNSPPEDAPNPWGFQPDFRPYHPTMHPFSQSSYPNFPPSAAEAYPHSLWGMPQPMYMRSGIMNMPRFDPMAPMWPNYGHSSQHFMPESNFYPNPYIPKMSGYNQESNRYVFGPKPNPNVPVFTGNRETIKNKRMSVDSINIKEPLFKKLRTQTDLQNNNLYEAKSNVFSTRSFESLVPDRVWKPYKTSAFQENISNENIQNSKLSKSHENISRMFSKSNENLTNFVNGRDTFELNNKEHIFNGARLSRSKSMDNPTVISPSEISSNFSLQNSFIFPLRKSTRTKSFDLTETSESSSKKNIQNSATTQGQEIKKTEGENSDNNLSESDLRHILLQKRRKSSFGQLQETNKEKAKKIRTSYSKDDQTRESSSKKHVTFNLGDQGSIIDDQNADNPHMEEMCTDTSEQYAEEVLINYLIPDTEILLKDFELLEELAKSDPSHVLFIADSVRRDIEAASGGGAGGGGARQRVMAARTASRRLALTHTHIQVQSLDTPVEGSSEPLIDCCLQIYEEGYNPILISDDQMLLCKATDLEIECYQTDDIKQHLSELKTAVTFEKTDENESAISVIPVNVSRKQLFSQTNDSNSLFLDKQKEISNAQNNKKTDNKNNRFLKNCTITNRKSFFDKDIDILKEATRKIENLNLQENNVQKSRYTASKKQHTEKENKSVFKKKNEAMEEIISAKKQDQNINVYNLDGHLKSFSIKSKEMEEGIRTKMDEYFCSFSQIMETVFLDISKDTPIPGCSSSLTPLQSSLHHMRAMFADHRTATLLIDKLGDMLDNAHTLINGRLMLNLEPQEFLKMFGCGTLLISVLSSILPSESCLCEGGRLLSLLETRIERGGEGSETPPDISGIPFTLNVNTHERKPVVKKSGEVLQYLSEHFPSRPRRDGGNDAEVNSKVKIVRTTGRDIGLLKLDPKKPLFVNDDERSCDDYKETYKDEEKENKSNKAKIIRKLAVESSNLPPKMKEIDVEKREKTNKECTEMLEQMVTCSALQKPVTRFYNLRSILVTNIDDSSNKTDTTKKHNITKLESQINNKIDSTTTIKTKDVNDHLKEQNNNKQVITREPLNLDAFDYSEMEESVTNDKDSISKSSSNKNQLVESDNSNYVTTTQRSNDIEISPSFTNNVKNYSNGNDKVNEAEVVKNANNNDVEHSVENNDSGIESEQACCFVQHFLTNLSSTFSSIRQFVGSSTIELRAKPDASTKERIHRKANDTRVIIARIIDNLKLISERESNPGTSVTPLLVQGASQSDGEVPIAKYRLLISKHAASARVLHDALKTLARLTQSHDSHTPANQ